MSDDLRMGVLQSLTFNLLILIPLLATEEPDRRGDDDSANGQSGQDLRPDHIQANAFEQDGPEDDHEVVNGEDIG